MAGDLIRGRALATSRRPGRRRPGRLRQRHRHDPRASTRPSAGSPSRQPSRVALAGADPGPLRRHRSASTDDSQIVERRQQPAVARPAAARRAAPPALRLHRPDRPDQLPHPAPARSARVGVGHDADPDRRASPLGAYAFGSALRGSSIIVNEVGDRPRRARTPPRAAPRSTSASSRRPAAPTRSPCPAARSCRRRSRRRVRRDQGASLDVLQGDRVARPRPGGRLRLAPDDPGRDRRPSCPKIHAELRARRRDADRARSATTRP